MKKTINVLLTMVFVLQLQVSSAQVKRQYQDETFAETTVVIKENDKVDDLEVLNSQFDLDDVAVGQVIRITTENERPPVPEQTPVAPKEAPVTVQTPAPQQKVASIPTEKKADKTPPSAGTATPKTSRRLAASGNYPKKSYVYPGKINKKRLKKSGKKHRSSNKKKCYQF